MSEEKVTKKKKSSKKKVSKKVEKAIEPEMEVGETKLEKKVYLGKCVKTGEDLYKWI